nr:MAG TPA_asm: hypothetical protein [Caudoviricetes sp.]
MPKPHRTDAVARPQPVNGGDYPWLTKSTFP